jgi:hypothetical protein
MYKVTLNQFIFYCVLRFIYQLLRLSPVNYYSTYSWEMTNVTHKFFCVYLFLFITLYMFPATRVHHQERQIVSIQPLVNCHSVLVAVSCAGLE